MGGTFKPTEAGVGQTESLRVGAEFSERSRPGQPGRTRSGSPPILQVFHVPQKAPDSLRAGSPRRLRRASVTSKSTLKSNHPLARDSQPSTTSIVPSCNTDQGVQRSRERKGETKPATRNKRETGGKARGRGEWRVKYPLNWGSQSHRGYPKG